MEDKVEEVRATMDIHQSLPHECNTYKQLSSFSRNKNTQRSGALKAACGFGNCCDKSGHSHRHPDWAGPGWYRFTGRAGTKMPDTGVFNSTGCGTDAQGWLAGGHPLGAGQQVIRTVNFNRLSNPAHKSVDVSVTHCKNFFVYRLPETESAGHTMYYSYCGE